MKKQQLLQTVIRFLLWFVALTTAGLFVVVLLCGAGLISLSADSSKSIAFLIAIALFYIMSLVRLLF